VANIAHIYVDGVDTTPSGGAVYPAFAHANDLNFGRFLSNTLYFDGLLDEARIAANVQSSNWVWASWVNVASNTAFASCSTINPQPLLSAVASTNGPLLTWSQAAGPFSLYVATNLVPRAIWVPATNPVILVNGQWEATIPPGSGSRFYRLQQ